MNNNPRGIVGRRVKIKGTRTVRKILRVVNDEGAVELNRPVEGIRYWHRDGLVFMRETFTEKE